MLKHALLFVILLVAWKQCHFIQIQTHHLESVGTKAREQGTTNDCGCCFPLVRSVVMTMMTMMTMMAWWRWSWDAVGSIRESMISWDSFSCNLSHWDNSLGRSLGIFCSTPFPSFSSDQCSILWHKAQAIAVQREAGLGLSPKLCIQSFVENKTKPSEDVTSQASPPLEHLARL